MYSLIYCCIVTLFIALYAHSKSHHDNFSPRSQLSHTRRTVAVPTTSNFVMRGFHSSVVLGDYLYIDGGEIAQLVDGELEIYPQNNTLSIDLRYSWTNDSVAFNVITKNAPVLNNLALWATDNGTSFYQWGGEQSSRVNTSETPVAENSLWRFDADGQGAGSWTAYSIPSGFSRTSNALYASGNGSGYLFGGYISSRTDPRNGNVRDMPSSRGLVSYNMATGAWANDTSCMERSCYRVNGHLDFIPTFGSNGVLVALGGCGANSSSFGTCKNSRPTDFSTIDIYDLSQKRWYTQTASNGPGQLPEPREGFCAVGLLGDNGTYEIFLFGGGVQSTDSTEGTTVQNYLDAVYVLSLPAFVWHKADYTPTRARTRHSCNIAGKRQMLVVGGVNPAGNIWLPADPWTQGLNVFDLTEMRWVGGYNVEAEDYITPAVVKSWYNENGMYPDWDSSEIQDIFIVNGQSTPSSNITAQPSATESTTANNESPGINTGVVAGGVIGGVVGLFLIVGFAFFLIRRRQRRSSVLNPIHPLPELHSDDVRAKELPA